MMRRIMALLLTVLLSFSGVMNTVAYEDEIIEEDPPIPVGKFRDVWPKSGLNTWFYDEVYYVKEKGIMTGMGNGFFNPYSPINRAQFMVTIHRMAGEPKTDLAADKIWEDLSSEEWYWEAVNWGTVTQIMNGYSSELSLYWGPADNITREQIVTVLYRYANHEEYATEKRAELDRFEDAASVSDFAKDAMQWAVAEELMKGKDSGIKLDPQGSASRAECAVIIQRFMEIYK